jgi:putative ABC transport system permease protein
MLLTSIGLALGVAGAFGLAQVLSSMLFNVEKFDPFTFCAVAASLLAMAFLACLIPARRAMRVSPIVALRYE